MLTYEMAHELLDYDPRTGLFKWRQSGKGRPKDLVACRETDQRYGRISYGGKLYQAHALAWLMSYGEWPKHQIDHINGDAWDNRLCNLRDVTPHENMSNLGVHRRGKLYGAQWSERLRKYQCQINVNKRSYYLGVFDDEAECSAFAEQARLTILDGKTPLKRSVYKKRTPRKRGG